MRKLYRVGGAAMLLAALALLDGCRGLPEDSEVKASSPGGAYRPVGAAIHREAGAVASATGCDLTYLHYRPTTPRHRGLVVLAHGFLRSKDRMAELAIRLAEQGIATVTLDFCNMRAWDGNHRQNGADMIRVARHLEAERVVYAGFSAGGLAAVVAASRDTNALGVLAMDLVDRDRIGVAAATGLPRPMIGLVGDPSSCNAQNNGLAVYAAAPAADVIRVQGASHCDFEAPTDGLCRALCEPSGRADADQLRQRIIAEAVSAIESLFGALPAAQRRPAA